MIYWILVDPASAWDLSIRLSGQLVIRSE